MNKFKVDDRVKVSLHYGFDGVVSYITEDNLIIVTRDEEGATYLVPPEKCRLLEEINE